MDCERKQKCFELNVKVESNEFFEEFYFDVGEVANLDVGCHIRLSECPAAARTSPLSSIVSIKYCLPPDLLVFPCVEVFVYNICSGAVIGQSWFLLPKATPAKPFQKRLRFSKPGDEFRFLGELDVQISWVEAQLLDEKNTSFSFAAFGSDFRRPPAETIF